MQIQLLSAVLPAILGGYYFSMLSNRKGRVFTMIPYFAGQIFAFTLKALFYQAQADPMWLIPVTVITSIASDGLVSIGLSSLIADNIKSNDQVALNYFYDIAMFCFSFVGSYGAGMIPVEKFALGAFYCLLFAGGSLIHILLVYFFIDFNLREGGNSSETTGLLETFTKSRPHHGSKKLF